MRDDARCDFAGQEIQKPTSHIDRRLESVDVSRMPLIPFFRQSPFRRFSQTIQPVFEVDEFDGIVEMEIV